MKDEKKIDFNKLANLAIAGNKSSLEDLLSHTQGLVFRICLRMVWSRPEAEDACQEILIKILTALSNFKEECKFETWVYRVAVNHLKDRKKSNIEKMNLNFQLFEEDLLVGNSEPLDVDRQAPDYQLQVDEIRIGCTFALLQCLDREHRLAYIIGEIFELDHTEASEILEIPDSTFRKRLERARDKVESFAKKNCSIINNENLCRCENRLNAAKSSGRLNSDCLQFSSGTSTQIVKNEIQKLEQARRTAAHYRRDRGISSQSEIKELLKYILNDF